MLLKAVALGAERGCKLLQSKAVGMAGTGELLALDYLGSGFRGKKEEGERDWGFTPSDMPEETSGGGDVGTKV